MKGIALRLVVALALLPTVASAQGMAERIKQQARERAEALQKKGDDKVDSVASSVLDKVECLATDRDCIRKAKAAGKPVELKDAGGRTVDEKGKVVAEAPEKGVEPQGAVAPASSAAWANFDFVPGSKVLFADDFAKDRVGNFPQRLELVVGNMEIVEVGGKRYLRSNGDPSSLRIPLPELLGPRFTVEFDVIGHAALTVMTPEKVARETNWFDSCDAAGWAEGAPTSVLCFSGEGGGIGGGGVRKSYRKAEKTGPYRVRIQLDGKYVKAYMDEERVVNFPSANFGRGKAIQVNLPTSEEEPIMIGNLVVASGGQQLYDALLADGRVATQGILFDTGSDRIRPESRATLQMIGDMLKEHPELKLMIEGHTDNVGAAAANKALSGRRAAAVRATLAASYGVDAGRLTSGGFGDTKPAAPNTTAEGRQQNRRVELVKI